MKRILFLSFLVVSLFSCNLTDGEVDYDPHDAAVPDSEVKIETHLSKADKVKLEQAKGKRATYLTISQLNSILESLEDKSALVYFWAVENEESDSAIKNIGKVMNQSNTDKMNVYLSNLNLNRNERQVNTLVRESGVDAEIFLMNDRDMVGGIIGNEGGWTGKFPAYYIYNTENKIGIWFEGNMEYAELYAMIQSFTI
ncbi:MAG: hypothetical protein ACI94Y_000304 [Maribacter sp.]|jgi:hypothetical protein